MFKSFFDGVAKKAGESFGAWLWPALIAGVTWLWVWLGAPNQLLFSRRQLLLIGITAGALLAISYIGGFYAAKRHFQPKVPPMDSLQEELLMLLWTQAHNAVPFGMIHRLTAEHRSRVRLAGERLQERGYIAFLYTSDESLLQLLPEGREYIAKEGLDKSAERLLVERLPRLES